jgi:hypothetical protein
MLLLPASWDPLLKRGGVMHKAVGALFICGMLLSSGASLFSHHSMAMFDGARVARYTGVVTRFSYTNPHVYVYVDVEKDGQKVNFVFEAASPFSLKEQGWTATSLQVGEKVSVVARPAKDNSNFGLLISVTKMNGRKLGSGPQVDP